MRKEFECLRANVPTLPLTVACIAGGGGGGAMGALLAGITPIWSIDFDPNRPLAKVIAGVLWGLNKSAH